MKYSIGPGGYPVGQFLIPTGTVVDYSGTSDFDKLARSAGPPPMNSVALDAEAWAAMQRHHPEHRHWLQKAF